ncbi:MAG: CinA family protein [Clostridia bacterium]|nr:CinA family protein [Clostridia bacterium]
MANQILKTYGISREEILEKLESVSSKYDSQVKITVKEKYLDATIDISTDLSDTVADAVREILQILKENVYAEGHETLYEKLADLLCVRNKKLCLFEQGSGGVITSNLMAIDGAGKHISESIIIPNADSWIKKFDIDPRTLRENNGISSKLVFMIASALRRHVLADFYVVTLASDANGLEVYALGEQTSNEITALVAIGDPSGVEIYKQTLSGDARDRINQTAKGVAFKLIHELKK